MSDQKNIDAVSLDELSFLKDLQLEFSTMAEMISTRAREVPDRVHVMYYDQKITYAETNARANRAAHYLKARGVEKGDVVSLMILNAPEIYDVMFGAHKLGAITGSINFMLKGPEIAYVLDDARPKVVFVGSEFMTDFNAGLELADHRPLVVEVRTEAEHQVDMEREFLDEAMAGYPEDEILVPGRPEDPFLLLYSSGTTGRPKGILLTNEGQMSICRGMTRQGLVQGDDVMIILLPMFHINPISVWTFPMTFCGQTLCIRKAFSPADFWPAIIDNGVTILQGVPAMYNYVYYTIDPSTIDTENLRLRYAFCGAAPLAVELIEGFKERFNVDIIEGYGLTEVTGVSTANPALGRRKAGSIGIPLPEQDIRIMDENLNELEPGGRGEICIRGKAVMHSYLNKPEATEQALVDGWLRTGDVGYMDEEGYFYIVDRKKDMINRGGENIYPREIEIVLEGHPEIIAAAVIGVPDKALGERVKVCVEPEPSSKLTGEDIKQYLSDKLAKYKIPEFIDILDQLPRNPTGKILKQKLRGKE